MSKTHKDLDNEMDQTWRRKGVPHVPRKETPQICPACDGWGWTFDNKPCPVCQGEGVVYE